MGQLSRQILAILIHTIMCRDRQTDRPDEKQYSQYSSQKARSRKTSQTDAIKYPLDCPHTEYTAHLYSQEPWHRRVMFVYVVGFLVVFVYCCNLRKLSRWGKGTQLLVEDMAVFDPNGEIKTI